MPPPLVPDRTWPFRSIVIPSPVTRNASPGQRRSLVSVMSDVTVIPQVTAPAAPAGTGTTQSAVPRTNARTRRDRRIATSVRRKSAVENGTASNGRPPSEWAQWSAVDAPEAAVAPLELPHRLEQVLPPEVGPQHVGEH